MFNFPFQYFVEIWPSLIQSLNGEDGETRMRDEVEETVDGVRRSHHNRMKRVLFNIIKHHRANTEAPSTQNNSNQPRPSPNTIEDFNPFETEMF